MKKREIVINDCFGGFGLSEEAALRYWKRKKPKKTFYIRKNFMGFDVWDIPNPIEPDSMARMRTYGTPEGQAANDEWHKHSYPYKTRIDRRDDPDLVAVVKELGTEKASGRFACLKIVSVPANVKWYIHEYDGSEEVHEKHRIWRAE